MHEQGKCKGTSVGVQLDADADADVASTIVRSMFQGLALGGISGRGSHPVCAPFCDLDTSLSYHLHAYLHVCVVKSPMTVP